MNPNAAHVALVLCAVAGGIFVAGLVFCTLLYGCAATLLPEPPYTETVAASLRDR